MNLHASDAQRQIARYRSLVRVTAALSRHVRTDDLLRAMHEQVRLLFDTPITLLARCVPGGGWHCLTLESDNVAEQDIAPRPDGLLERVLRGTLRLENDLPAYLRRESLGIVRLHHRSDLPHTLSWMGVPLHAGEVTGVLSVQSYAQGAFTPEDLEFLELLGVHLSIALENAALHERVEREAHTDPLTGLWNRRGFGERGEAALRAAHRDGARFTLAVMDLQDFKAVNDRFGHAVGDEVLTGLGLLLRRLTGRGAHVFRLGGDEFAVLLPGDSGQARGTLSRWLEDVRGHPWPTAAPPHLNIGLAQAHPGYSMSDWLREADTQMYEAKRRRLHLLGTEADRAGD
ncbi:sensor domain-containing diguanylate cyclase [Deinococcus depolymerans]|uniref:GGDEF domain-containing protein n=1 Tax=Deinococcus depolymerans TaxID=392408 RepID=A0ABN1C6L2_9DEIO